MYLGAGPFFSPSILLFVHDVPVYRSHDCCITRNHHHYLSSFSSSFVDYYDDNCRQGHNHEDTVEYNS